MQKTREQDRRIAERNANVTRIDDPNAQVSQAELVSLFDSTQTDNLNLLARLFVEQAGGLASVQSVQEVLAKTVGESADLDATRIGKLLNMLSEAKFVQTMAENLELEPAVRAHLLNRYIDREWGPPLPPPLVVRTETRSDANSASTPKRRGPIAAERPTSGEDRPRPAARGGISVGPFGAIPSSSR